MRAKSELNNVVTKNQYQRIMEMVEKPPYHYKNLSTREIIPMKVPFINEDGTVMVHHFPKCYVGNVLNSDIFFYNLTPEKSAFISSQTGAGKTTFILKTVLNNFVRQGKRILILSSRTLLSNKLKHDTIKVVKPELEEEFTETGLSRKCEYETVDIIGYQQIFNENVDSKYLEIFEKNISTYGVVIFDEAHFFVSDASFNRYTEKIFRYLTHLCFKYKIPRVYMTATPEAVFDVILERERELRYNNSDFMTSYKNCILNFYHFDRDYSYIDIYPFDYQSNPDDNIKATAQLIKDDKNRQYKWIVFIDKTDFASKLKDNLEKDNWRVCELNSEIIHNSISYEPEITKKTLDSLNKEELIPNDVDVLISTKCLDVGISIKNKNISIISFLTDPNDFIQAIGRKRVTSKEERVHLYFPKYTLKLLQTLYNATNGALHKMEETISFNTPGTTANGSSCDMPIYVDNGKFNFNEYSLVNMRNKLNFFDSIIDACSKGMNADDTNIILSHFYKLLGLESRFETSYDNMGSATGHSKLLAIVQNYSKSQLSEDKLKELFEELASYSNSKPRKDRPAVGIKKANIILKKIGYKIKKCQSKDHKSLYKLYQI